MKSRSRTIRRADSSMQMWPSGSASAGLSCMLCMQPRGMLRWCFQFLILLATGGLWMASSLPVSALPSATHAGTALLDTHLGLAVRQQAVQPHWSGCSAAVGHSTLPFGATQRCQRWQLAAAQCFTSPSPCGRRGDIDEQHRMPLAKWASQRTR